MRGTIVVWFSCGAASAVAAKKTIEQYGATYNIRVVNNPIKEEHPDNVRFLKDVEKWLGLTIEFAINKKYPNCSIVEVFDKKKYMSGVAGAPCTYQLKKEARYQFESENKIDFHVLGFTSEEKRRYDRFILTERENVLHVLRDTTKQQCFEILQEAGIELPLVYKLGMPNANCIGCVKSSSPTYWNLVREIAPDVFQERDEQSFRIGCKLVKHKGKRMFLHELPIDAKGRHLNALKSIDCGIFCEEK